MTFKQWLKEHRNDNSPIGDIARDILADVNFPNTQNVAEIEDYATKKGLTGIDAASEAFKSAYSQWLASL